MGVVGGLWCPGDLWPLPSGGSPTPRLQEKVEHTDFHVKSPNVGISKPCRAPQAGEFTSVGRTCELPTCESCLGLIRVFVIVIAGIC